MVKGERVDTMRSTLTVVNEHGRPLASFVKSDVVTWCQLQKGSSPCPINAD